MTENLKAVSPAQRIAYKWGWANPGADIIRLAERCDSLIKSQDPKEALLAFDVLDRTTIERLHARCPGDTDLLDYAAEQEQVVVQPRLDAIRATMAGLPYYPNIGVLSAHAALSTDAVVARCEQLGCVLMVTDEKPVAVFSQFRNLLNYRSLGRGELGGCAIFKAIGKDDLQYAIGEQDEIHQLLQSFRKTDSDSDTESVRVWNALSAESYATEEGRQLQRLIDHAVKVGATDIKIALTPNGAPEIAIRRHGRLIEPAHGGRAPRDLAARMISLLEQKSGANPNHSEYRTPINGHLRYRSSAGEVVMRLSFIPLNHLGQNVSLKSVSLRIFTFRDKPVQLDKLQLHDEVIKAVRKAVRQRQGLILFCGPTNSGKSTGIAGALGEHVQIYGDSLKRLTVEDPVERLIPSTTQFNVPARVVGEDGIALTKTQRLTSLLQAVLRHDPDTVFVGEIPGEEMAKLCVSFAASGHLALSTLHANNSMLAFERLRNMLDTDMAYQLSESLLLIVSQRLIPTVCKNCGVVRATSKAEKQAWQEYLVDLGVQVQPKPRPKRVKAAKSVEGASADEPAIEAARNDGTELPSHTIHPNPDGCDCCSGGFDGVMPINEVLPFTRDVRDAACAYIGGESTRDRISAGRTVTFPETALALLREHSVSLESVITEGR